MWTAASELFNSFRTWKLFALIACRVIFVPLELFCVRASTDKTFFVFRFSSKAQHFQTYISTRSGEDQVLQLFHSSSICWRLSKKERKGCLLCRHHFWWTEHFSLCPLTYGELNADCSETVFCDQEAYGAQPLGFWPRELRPPVALGSNRRGAFNYVVAVVRSELPGPEIVWSRSKLLRCTQIVVFLLIFVAGLRAIGAVQHHYQKHSTR